MDRAAPRKTGVGTRALMLIMCAAAFVIYIWNAGDFSTIYVSSDEMGYLGSAAFFAGRDWSPVLSNLGYYSYGYPLLLSPLFAITSDTALIYKLAIIINGVMAAAVIPVSFSVSRRLFPNLCEIRALCACFAVSLYSAYILQVYMARNESLLFLLVWLIILLFLKSGGGAKAYVPALLAALLFYSYMVHQRMLGVLIAGWAVILIMFIKKRISLKHLIIFAAVTALMLVIHTILKDYVKGHIWLNSQSSGNNDFENASGKLGDLFTGAGFMSFMKTLAGQVFYLGAASFLLYYMGAGGIFKNAACTLRREVFTKKTSLPGSPQNAYALLFIAAAAVLTALLSALFLIRTVRLDHIIYGRYNEVLAGPVILFALHRLFEREKPPIAGALACAGVYAVLGFVTGKSVVGLGAFASISSPGMAWLEPYFANGWGLVIALPIVIFAGLVVLASIRTKRGVFEIITCVLLGVTFVLCGRYPVTHTLLPGQSSNLAAVEAPAALIEQKIPASGQVNFYGDGEDAWQFSFLQYALPEHSFSAVDGGAGLLALPDGALVAGTASGLFDPALSRNADLLESSSRFSVWSVNHNKQSEDGIVVPVSLFFTQNGSIQADGSILSNGQAGYLLYGPYISLPPGNYELSAGTTLTGSATGPIGNMDVFCESGVLASMPISAELFEHGKATLSLPFTVPENTQKLEFRLYTNGGAKLAVTGVELRNL